MNPPNQSSEENHAELGLGAPGGAIEYAGKLKDPSAPPEGWYSRGYLPHYSKRETLQSVTFRLADAMPQSKLRQIEKELVGTPPEKMDAARRKQIEAWLDAGIGCCALRHPALASLMRENLLKWEGDRYRLYAWCIMPNHVHVLMMTHAALSKIVQSWKSFTGRWALEKNAELGLGVPGKALWMREYWDRYIRDPDHFDNVRHYIEQNPVAARLCAKAADWPWSSVSGSLPGAPSPSSA